MRGENEREKEGRGPSRDEGSDTARLTGGEKGCEGGEGQRSASGEVKLMPRLAARTRLGNTRGGRRSTSRVRFRTAAKLGRRGLSIHYNSLVFSISLQPPRNSFRTHTATRQPPREHALGLHAMPRPTLRVQAAATAGGAGGARRTFPAAKALAFREQAHLLTHHDLVLFLRPGDFAAHEWRTIRQQIAAVPPPPPPPSNEEGSIRPTADGNNQLRLTYLRPGLMPAIVRTLQQQRPGTVPDTSLLSDASHSSGPLAALTAPTLHPPTLLRVLHLLQTFSRTPPPNAPPPPPPSKGKDAAGPPVVVERLKLLSSLLEQTTAADPDRTTQIAQLPPIEVLHAQIVGLLSAPGARITGVVSARATELARTLEGFKLGLEEAAAPASSSSESVQGTTTP